MKKKGDITFLKDETSGEQYQQILDGTIEKIIDGCMKYKSIETINENTIKYNMNGVYGFSVWKKKNNLEDNIWTLAEAEGIAKEL